MNKTYFCSDTHFDHSNILKYEPQRINYIIDYIFNYLDDEIGFLEKLDYLNKKYGNDISYVHQYNASVTSQMIDADDFVKRVIECVYDDTNFYFNDCTKEENDNWHKLQQEQKQVILDYHNEMLIAHWNEVVDVNDIVYFLGDFAFKNKTKAEIIGRRLNGHKTIILGNHDDRKHNQDGSIKYNHTLEAHFKACGFERVEFNPIMLKGKFILSHEPIFRYEKERIIVHDDLGELINIYGHVHSNPLFETKTSDSICVCLDRHSYKPIELEEYNKYTPN